MADLARALHAEYRAAWMRAIDRAHATGSRAADHTSYRLGELVRRAEALDAKATRIAIEAKSDADRSWLAAKSDVERARR